MSAKTMWIKQPEDMDREELFEHLSADHDSDGADRDLGLLLEDHTADHESVISNRLIIRHYHRSDA